MNSIYRTIGISKQAFHQRLDRLIIKEEEKANLLPVINQIREDHPRMGSRQMYQLINPCFMGRDAFELFCFEHGYKLKQIRSYVKTTNSLGVTRFNNLIKDFKLTGVNQVWVSDITYFWLKDQFCYLTFVMDMYSRRIVGYSVSKDLLTVNTTIPALQMGIRSRAEKSFKGLIFHSDGGGQYYSKKFLEITRKHKILNSMAYDVYENPHAERVNGTIKNQYLIPYHPENYSELKKCLKKSVLMYNCYRPHSSLGSLSPLMFEEKVNGFPQNSGLLTKRKKEAKKEKGDNNNDIFELMLKQPLKTVNVI